MLPSASDNPHIVHVHTEVNEMSVNRLSLRRGILLPDSADDLTVIPFSVLGNRERVRDDL